MFTIGIDLGTKNGRTLIVDVETGQEIATSVWHYRHGQEGVIIDPNNPTLARQDPRDYLNCIEATVAEALEIASGHPGFSPAKIIGLGVATTGSTILPVDQNGKPLAFYEDFGDNLAAMAWLWKDHTSTREAEEITQKAAEMRPHYLAKCGGIYSSEWYWANILHCIRTATEVYDAAYTWVEIADLIPAILTGTDHPTLLKRATCPAGHKGMSNHTWGGYPDKDFLTALDPRLAQVRETLPNWTYNVAELAGYLVEAWAQALGLPVGTAVAMGAFDAHLAGAGAGIGPYKLVMILGTSNCMMMVYPLSESLPDIPGLCGIVPESILPGYYGLEAGQSGFGDVLAWLPNVIKPRDKTHLALEYEASQLAPGQSGLLALDWFNGNRTILVDQRLSGLILGFHTSSSAGEIYRALIEALAFGARVIMERFEEYGLKVKEVITCGGIAGKNELVMQILADVLNREILISRSDQTSALGAAMAGAVVAGKEKGGYDNFEEAIENMTGVQEKKYVPDRKRVAVYDRLYRLYRMLHDAFGTQDYKESLHGVMKELLRIRDQVRSGIK